MFHWEPEGCYHHRLCTAIVPIWFPMEHLWTALTPFWLSSEDTFLVILDGVHISFCNAQVWIRLLWAWQVCRSFPRLSGRGCLRKGQTARETAAVGHLWDQTTHAKVLLLIARRMGQRRISIWWAIHLLIFRLNCFRQELKNKCTPKYCFSSQGEWDSVISQFSELFILSISNSNV